MSLFEERGTTGRRGRTRVGGMHRGADILVTVCAGVREGEHVLVVTDAQRRPIGEAILAAAEFAGGDSTMLVIPPREIDNEEPVSTAAMAMAAADVVFLPVTHSLAHTRAVREAIRAGARVLSMTAFTEHQMTEGGLFVDFLAREPVCRQLGRMFTSATEVRVVGPGGTDLRMGIEGRPGNGHAGVIREAGFTAVPNIEASVSPVGGTANGVFVSDGSIPYFSIGVLTEPVRFDIEDGFVREISGGDQAAVLRDLLAVQDDPWVHNLAQFAVGLNPECREFTGEVLNDEGVDGTVHIGIGKPASVGGDVLAKTQFDVQAKTRFAALTKTHFAALAKNPTVWLDGEVVVEEGRVLIQP